MIKKGNRFGKRIETVATSFERPKEVAQEKAALRRRGLMLVTFAPLFKRAAKDELKGVAAPRIRVKIYLLIALIVFMQYQMI